MIRLKFKSGAKWLKQLVVLASLLVAYCFFHSVVYAQAVGVVAVPSPILPVITVTQTDTSLVASASDDNLDGNSWRYATSTTDPTCTEMTYGDASADNRTHTLTAASHQLWYCFQVADTDGNIAYQKHQVIISQPEPATAETSEPAISEEPVAATPATSETTMPAKATVTVTQTGTTVQAVSSQINFNDPQHWRLRVVSSVDNCNATAYTPATAGAPKNQLRNLTHLNNGQVYCFRVATAENDYAYGSIVVSGIARVTAPATPVAEPAEPTPEPEEPAEGETTEPEEEVAEPTTTSTDDMTDDSTVDLRLIGLVIVGLGIVAILVVVILARRADEPEPDDDDDDDF